MFTFNQYSYVSGLFFLLFCTPLTTFSMQAPYAAESPINKFTEMLLDLLKGRSIQSIDNLTKRGADVNVCMEGRTPLGIALAQGRKDIAEALIFAGASVDAEDVADTQIRDLFKDKDGRRDGQLMLEILSEDPGSEDVIKTLDHSALCTLLHLALAQARIWSIHTLLRYWHLPRITLLALVNRILNTATLSPIARARYQTARDVLITTPVTRPDRPIATAEPVFTLRNTAITAIFRTRSFLL